MIRLPSQIATGPMNAPLPRPASLAPLRYGVFRAIWLATLVSNLGGLIQAVGAAWMMTALTPSAAMVALVQAALTLPIMLFSLASGAMADSFDRRRVMLAAQGFMLATSAALAAAAWAGLLTPWLLLGFTFLIGCGTALNNPSWQASVGDMVPRQDLPAAVALNSVGFNLTRSVGPAIGGALVASLGSAAAFLANTASYLPLILVLLLRWRPEAAPSPLPREAMLRAMGSGLRYVALSPGIRRVLLRSFVFGLAAIAFLALLPLVARDLAGGPLTYGALLGAFGFGAVAAAFLAPRLRAALTSEGVVRLAFGGLALALAVAAPAPGLWATGAAALLAGASWVTALSLFNTSVQLSAPRWVVGRALSLYQTATFGGMALGSWLWGRLAETQGVGTALLAAAAVMVAGGAIGLVLRLPGADQTDLAPLGRWKEPHVAIDVTARSGPVAVTIEYRVKAADLGSFLDTMTERRRIRRRDGARGWTLLRNLEDPDLWYESYQTPTWTDYIRHNSRATQADAVVGERLRALHGGKEPPRVHRMIVRQPEGGHIDPTPKAPMDIH